MNDIQWERYVYLLAGVETITFTAIGWLFGKEVHREQAQQAKARFDEAQMAMSAMDSAAKEQTKGKMIGKAVMAHANDPNMEPLVAIPFNTVELSRAIKKMASIFGRFVVQETAAKPW